MPSFFLRLPFKAPRNRCESSLILINSFHAVRHCGALYFHEPPGINSWPSSDNIIHRIMGRPMINWRK